MIAAALHGGDVAGIARRHGRPMSDYIDFSANINPLGPPLAVRAALLAYARGMSLTHYPEPGLPALAIALARARDVAADAIVVHGGSAALFDAILRAVKPRRLGLIVPAFAEYARAATASGTAVRSFALDLDGPAALDEERFGRWLGDDEIDTVILTNPHNPLGFGLPAATIRRIVAGAAGTTFIVDEAFADYVESVSVARDAAFHPRLIVVRSVTKFFAIPDLRVGYAIMRPDRASAVRAFIPAWPVSGIAAVAAMAALDDPDFAERSRASNERNRPRLAGGLTEAGVRVLPGAANFLTFATREVGALREWLIRERRLIIRDCSSFDGLPADTYARVAVRDEHDNATLLAALRAR